MSCPMNGSAMVGAPSPRRSRPRREAVDDDLVVLPLLAPSDGRDEQVVAAEPRVDERVEPAGEPAAAGAAEDQREGLARAGGGPGEVADLVESRADARAVRADDAHPGAGL